MNFKCKCKGMLAPNAMCGNITVNESGYCGVDWENAEEAELGCEQIQIIEPPNLEDHPQQL